MFVLSYVRCQLVLKFGQRVFLSRDLLLLLLGRNATLALLFSVSQFRRGDGALQIGYFLLPGRDEHGQISIWKPCMIIEAQPCICRKQPKMQVMNKIKVQSANSPGGYPLLACSGICWHTDAD